MQRQSIAPLLLVALLVSACSDAPSPRKTSASHRETAVMDAAGGGMNGDMPPKDRTLLFTYTATVAEIPAGTQELQLWIPAPQNLPPLQEVLDERISEPAGAVVKTHSAPSGPNRWWHVKITAPKAPVVVTADMKVRRREQINNYFRGTGQQELPASERESLREELGPYELVPVGGRMQGLAESVAPGEKNVVNVARKIYDHVLEHMRYSKDGTGWGRGDSVWACDSGFGNCTDFHSLFMSMSKARGIPARFHMGFPITEARGEGKIGGYHCWAEFYVHGMGWVPIDISEADKHPELAQYYFGALTEDRISFVTGRDLALTPPPAAGRRNIFIYPHGEADGKELKVEKAFSYKDV